MAMATDTPETARTQTILAANGTTFAYRLLGPSSSSSSCDSTGVPLLLHMGFRGNMDHWDPALLNGLLASTSARPVILFDQAGVGRSSGTVKTTFQGWADDLISFVDALGLPTIDLLGFSMGGIAAQMVALTREKLVRRLVLVDATASAPSSTSAEGKGGIVWPRERENRTVFEVLLDAVTPKEGRDAIAFVFFPDDEQGRAAAAAYWERIASARPHVDGEGVMLELLNRDGADRQAAAYAAFQKPDSHGSFDRLGELEMPVLVMHGSGDKLVPKSRAWELEARIPDAQLIVHARASHGFLFQYPEAVAKYIDMFLVGDQ